MDIKQTNDDLIRFWGESICLGEEDKQALADAPKDVSTLAPSQELFTAAKSLGDCKRVLDYGCGHGWASVIAASSGAKEVEAVDMSPSIIEAASCYAEAFGVGDRIDAHVIDAGWLSRCDEGTYDAVFCSNVLDVVPKQTAGEIIKGLYAALAPKGKAIIGLNFFLSPEAASKRGMNLEDGYLFVNGILRLSNLNDEEWSTIFEPFFVVEKLEHFAWAGEEMKTRRLFWLRKR